jgi:hypothetical protein
VALSVDSMRERAAQLVAGLRRAREWLGVLAEEQLMQALALFRSEMRRAALTLVCALMAAFFGCAACSLAILSLFLALWEHHRILAGALATALCALLALGSVLVLKEFTRSPLGERYMRCSPRHHRRAL